MIHLMNTEALKNRLVYSINTEPIYIAAVFKTRDKNISLKYFLTGIDVLV